MRRVIDYLTQRFPGRPLFLLGHSWGGFLAIKVGERDSSGIAGIVSVSATFDPTATVKASYEHTLAWAKRAGRDSMLPELNRTTALGQLSAIRLPLLLLVRERDLITPPESLREPYSRWGGPKSFVVRSRSHHLPFVDEPARFSELVAEFLRRWAGRPAPSAGSRRPVAA